MGNHVAAKLRVPHISLVFREMWDTTAFDQRVFESDARGNWKTTTTLSTSKPRTLALLQ